MPARRSGQAELRSFIEFAEPKYLSDHLELLAAPLGFTSEDIEQLRLLEPDELARELRGHVQHQRAAHRAAQAQAAEERAVSAAAALGQAVEWVGSTALLDARLLLTELPAHRTAKLIGFEGPGWVTAVGKGRLREAQAALGRKVGLTASVDVEGLHLRWHDGRGGLDLRPVPVSPHGHEPVLVVQLRPPVVPSIEQSPPATTSAPGPTRARRRGGAWLGELLGDLGFLG